MFYLAIVILLQTFSCRDKVTIESTPYGADAYWKDENIGKTPWSTHFGGIQAKEYLSPFNIWISNQST